MEWQVQNPATATVLRGFSLGKRRVPIVVSALVESDTWFLVTTRGVLAMTRYRVQGLIPLAHTVLREIPLLLFRAEAPISTLIGACLIGAKAFNLNVP